MSSVDDDLFEPIEIEADEKAPPIGHIFVSSGLCSKCGMSILDYVVYRGPCPKK